MLTNYKILNTTFAVSVCTFLANNTKTFIISFFQLVCSLALFVSMVCRLPLQNPSLYMWLCEFLNLNFKYLKV